VYNARRLCATRTAIRRNDTRCALNASGFIEMVAVVVAAAGEALWQSGLGGGEVLGQWFGVVSCTVVGMMVVARVIVFIITTRAW
jgi:hypothetical protein